MAQVVLLGLVLLHRAAALSRRAVVVDASSLVHSSEEEVNTKVRNVVHHLHIPKVAGISFGIDEYNILQNHSLKQFSSEGCFGDARPDFLGTSLLLRNPRKHVISMFDFCWSDTVVAYREDTRQPSSLAMPETLEPWVHAWRQMQDSRWHGDFTPDWHTIHSGVTTESKLRAARIAAWSQPPFRSDSVFLDEKDWAVLDGGGTIWHHVNVPFQCYSPLNFQTQRLSCSRPMEYPETPDLDLALRNVESALFLGVLEHYQASICLLQTKLGHLPPYCDCRQRQQWDLFPFKAENVNEKKRTNEKKLNRTTIEEIDQLVAADWQLYKAGLRRFAREVAEAEMRFSTKLLCNVTLQF